MVNEGTNAPERTVRILEVSFADDLDALSTAEIRRRRDETLAERDFQSYLRRLIQARQDLLNAERGRRHTGGADSPLVDRLTAVLAAGPKGGSRGEALRMQLPVDDMAEAERRVGQVMGHTFLTEPGSLSDEQLDQALEVLEREERRVSGERGAVFRVHDRLQEELKRRYRLDPSQIPGQI